jgi:hypothetical protein
MQMQGATVRLDQGSEGRLVKVKERRQRRRGRVGVDGIEQLNPRQFDFHG